MREYPTQHVAFTIEREMVDNRWESHRWQLLGAVPDVGGEARTILESPARLAPA